MIMRHSSTRSGAQQQGFSILEMMLATVILLVGLVSVAQLVPASLLMNYRNRMDSSALVFAQRQLDVILDQPLNPLGNSFTDLQGNTYQLGNPATPNVVQGNNVVKIGNETLIDFSGPAPATYPTNGYGFLYQDLTDPNGAIYDVRWAVIVTGNGGTASSKRFILGVRQRGGNGFFLPITLDTMVSR
jgi:prepilin-type N-terminal cleavage/methylation domain-containing protein